MKKLFGILLVLALVLSFSLVATTPVAADTITVGPGGLPTYDHATIQAAIDAADPAGGDTIIVAEGTYYEALLIDGKSLTIQGAGVGESIVDGTGVGGSHVLRIQNVSAGSVAVDGFTIQNAPGTPSGFPVVISGCHAPASVAVTNNAIVASKLEDWGVYAAGSTASIVINHNAFHDYWMNAVLIERATGPVEVGHNTFKMVDDGGPAIFSMSYMSGADPCDVDGLHWYHHNTISAGSPGEAIYGGIIMASAYGVFYGQRSNGAYENVIIEGNVISDLQSWSRGVQLEIDGPDGGFTGPQVIDNTITGSEQSPTSFGIRLLGDVSDPIIIGNTVGNLGYGVQLRGTFGEPLYPTGVRIARNSIVGNTYGVMNEGSDVADATLNWWGDASGPGGVGPGTGDAVSTNVLYNPWLMEKDGAETTETDTESGEDAAASTTNVSATATGGGTDTTVSVAEYVGNPTGVSPGFRSGAVYIDVHVGGTLPTQLVVEIACPGSCSGVELQWWDGDAWESVDAPTSVVNGKIQVVLSATSSPTIAELTGTPFGLGSLSTVGWEGSSVNKAAVAAPWLALLATMMAGATLLVVRRRRAQI